MPSFEALRGAAPLGLLFALCAVATAAALPVLLPVLRRYALARPNARSSHREPTPQGAGLAVVSVTLLAVCAVLASPGIGPRESLSLATLAAAALVLAGLGAWDDIHPLPALLRLAIQALAVTATVFTLPETVRLLPAIMPVVAERVILVVAVLWFVNLTNFMDGLDWMTVAGFLPLSVGAALLAAAGAAPVAAGVVGAALAGSLAGFAPLNRPVARVFLGDVGSLPIGLLAAYALIRVGGDGHLLAAIIMPLYYAADATITLVRRLARGEKVWEAHRSHFYQQATTNGLSVMGVVGRVALVNLTLAGTAAILAVAWTPARGALGAVVAAASVAALLADFANPRAPR
jgi:UDP-N-acetylmuramyl pentapeptide phosphotransferase/UDP-N-acetylglucosamine-1-phosphate transferase